MNGRILQLGLTWALVGGLACAPKPPSVEEHLARQRVDPVAATMAPGEATDDRVVAEFAGGTLTVGEVRRWTDAWTEYDRMRYQTPDRRRELVLEIVALELLAREALRAGYDRRPEIVAALKREVARAWLEDRVGGAVSMKDLTEPEALAFYEAHRAEFVTGETRRVRHVRVSREALALQVRRELDEALAAVPPGEALRAFERLVEQYSDDRDTRGAGGDLGWLDAEGRVRGLVRDAVVCEELARAAFQVEGGAGPVGPVACGESFSVGLVVEARPQRQQPFEEVRSRVLNRMLQQRRELARRELIDRLRAEAGVRLDEAAVAALESPGAEQRARVRLPSVPRLGVNPAALPMLRPEIHDKAKELDEATRRALIEEQAGRVHR